MAPISWLPPLNSHSNYHMCVMGSQSKESRRIESGRLPLFLLKITASAIFSSDNIGNGCSLEGLSMERTYGIPASIIDWPTECQNCIRNILAHMNIPLEFDECTWRCRYLNGKTVNQIDRVQNLDAAIKEFYDFLKKVKTKPHNKDFTVLPVNLAIMKSIVVPDAEFKEWLSWYDEMVHVDPDFETEYARATSRPRTEDELLYEDSLRFNSATKTAIEALKHVRIEDSRSTRSCSICLEELQVGSRAIRLDCSHMFDEDCIIRWLRQSHMCPLCRFKLPTD